MPIKKTLEIVRGKTCRLVLRYETTPIVRKPIVSIDFSTGAPRLEVTGHGLVDGWRAYCYGIKGPTELNAESPDKIKDRDYFETTSVDANHVEFNSVNAANFKPYTADGFLAWNTPGSLAGKTCDVVVRDKPGGVVLLSSRAADAPLNLITSVVDDAAKKITISIGATATEAINWKSAWWEAELRASADDVESLVAPSPVVVGDEVAS